MSSCLRRGDLFAASAAGILSISDEAPMQTYENRPIGA